MAIQSKELARISAPGYMSLPLEAHDDSGKLRIKRFNVVIDKEDKLLSLTRLPGGHKNIMGMMSFFAVKGAEKEHLEGITFDLGVANYTDLMSVDIPAKESNCCLDKGVAIKTGQRIGTQSPDGVVYIGAFETQDVFMTLNKPLPVGCSVHGYLIYVKD